MTAAENASALTLFLVTLPWRAGEPGAGEHSAFVWAATAHEAIQLTAENMAQDLERHTFTAEMIRRSRVDRILAGASESSAQPLHQRIAADISLLLSGPTGRMNEAAAKALPEILRSLAPFIAEDR